MYKIILSCLGFIMVLIGLIVWKQKTLEKPQDKLQVVTSFYPLYFFATQIAQDHASIINLAPPGAEPHDYEPNTQDIAAIENSDILILNGAGLEAWQDKVSDLLQNKNVQIVIAAEDLAQHTIEEEGRSIQDPHIWLDPVLAKQVVQKITNTFIKIDPQNREGYQTNSNQLLMRLDQLNTDYMKGLTSCKQKNAITSHAAFGYVASRYGFNQVPITGISPDEEPSPKQLSSIASFARQNQIKAIFFETLVSPRLAQTIAQEIGAQTVIFNPLEGISKQEQDLGKDYFTIQQENIKNLQIALECN